MAKWNITGRISPMPDGSFEVDLTAETDRPVRKASPTVGAASEDELVAEVERLSMQLGGSLAGLASSMADLMAAENKRGKVSLRRVVNEIYLPLGSARDKYGDEAIRFGMEQAVAKGIPNVNYAKKAAASYGEGAGMVASTSTTDRYDILGRDAE